MPNLRFLDSSPVDELERDEALRRCYWMCERRTPSGNLNTETMDRGSTSEYVVADVEQGTQVQNVRHAICFEEPSNVDEDRYLGDRTQLGENLQLLTLVSADNQIASRTQQQQPRGECRLDEVLYWNIERL